MLQVPFRKTSQAVTLAEAAYLACSHQSAPKAFGSPLWFPKDKLMNENLVRKGNVVSMVRSHKEYDGCKS